MARDIFSTVTRLIKGFPDFLAVFLRDPPFSRPEQLQNHLTTIELRRRFNSAGEAIANDQFNDALYRTLQSWGIGMRASNLVSGDKFREALRAKAGDIASLDGIRIDDASLDRADLITQLWKLISTLGIVSNDATIVSGTKALHHILPELVVPVDRAYTQKFFGWQNPQFQYGQQKSFATSFKSFARIARAVDLDSYVAEGWCTSITKVIDNAVVGFVRAEEGGI